MLNVLITFTIVAVAFDVTETGKRWEVVTQWMFFKTGKQHFCQFLNTGFILRVTDVDNFAIAASAFVFNDAIQGFDTIANVGKAAFLLTAFNQLNR